MPYITPPAAPLDTICRQITFPADPYLLAALNGAITSLGKVYNWDKALGSSALDPLDVVTLLTPFIEDFLVSDCGVETPEEQARCTWYPAGAGFITYAPQNPYNQPDYVPAGYPAPPFYVAGGGVLSPFLPGDVLTDLSRFPVYANLIDAVAEGLPRLRIHVTSVRPDAVVELHLLTHPQGGYALITYDDDPLTNSFVDLNSVGLLSLGNLGDLFSLILDGGLVTESIVEVKLPTVGNHHVDVTFLPNVGIDILVGFGGGIRGVELCGAIPQEGVFMPIFDISDCVLRWKPSAGDDWIDIGNVCGADGVDGRTPTIWNDDGVLRWAYADDVPGTTQELIDLSSVVGGTGWSDSFACRVAFGVAVGLIKGHYIPALQSIYDGKSNSDPLTAIRADTLPIWGLTTSSDAFYETFVDNVYSQSLAAIQGQIDDWSSDGLHIRLATAIRESLGDCGGLTSAVWEVAVSAFQTLLGFDVPAQRLYEAVYAAEYDLLLTHFGGWFVAGDECDCALYTSTAFPYCREWLFQSSGMQMGWEVYNDGIDDWGQFSSGWWESVQYTDSTPKKGRHVAFELDVSSEVDIRIASINVDLTRAADDDGTNYILEAVIIGDKVGSLPIYSTPDYTSDGFITIDIETGLTTASTKVQVVVDYYGDNLVNPAGATLKAGNLRVNGEAVRPLGFDTGDTCISEG